MKGGNEEGKERGTKERSREGIRMLVIFHN